MLAVSSVPPPSGVEELADAIDAHRDGSDLVERRVRARRGAALREFTAEHGERALRDLGGRREAERLLERQDPAAGVTELVSALEAGAVSRRKRQPAARARTGRCARQTKALPAEPRSSGRLGIDIGILAAVFAVTVGIAELAGAANLGVAIGVGQVTFAIALVALLLRG